MNTRTAAVIMQPFTPEWCTSVVRLTTTRRASPLAGLAHTSSYVSGRSDRLSMRWDRSKHALGLV